ncbi:MAG: ABC transporter substrate-binding protein [Candidatus Promineifilaceae bacterium]|nr:ABC transporter substrate-binding protein [Candidatus Promineifilaceae bacterium]
MRALRFMILIVAITLLAACGGAAQPEVVQEVVEREVTRIVEETIVETVVVEGTPEVVEQVVTRVVQEVVEVTPEPGDTSKFGGVLNRQMQHLTQLDPIYIEDSTWYAASNIFSSLFRTQGLENRIMPDLATSWEWEDDTTIVFNLRQGVMWHDDNEVFSAGESREAVADDVVYSIERHLQTEGAAPPSDLQATFESVEAVDDYTVRLRLNAPNALLFSRGRGLTKTAIVPREAVEHYGDEFGLNPIGSGPFKFVEYRPDESLTLERNELYWKQPYLDGVVYHVIPDGEAALIAFENGEVDILWQVPPSELDRLESDSRFVLHGGGCPVQAQLIYNVNHPLWGEQAFRQAVSYALDGEAINQNVMGRMHIRGAGTAGPGVPGYVPALFDKYFPYDPEGARELLASLGWEDSDGDGILDKDGEALSFTLEVFNSDTNAQFAAAIVTQLQEVGIDAQVETVEVGTYVEDFQTGAEKIFLMTGWCGDGGTNSLWGRGGFASPLGYDDAEIFDLLDQANEIGDPAERDSVLQAATEKIYSQYWGTSLSFHDFFSASRSYVHDFGGTMWYENLVTEENNVWLDK